MIIMETNPSMYMIIVVAIITATTFTTAQTTAQTTEMITDVITVIETDSTTDTTTSDANTLSFTTNSSLSSSSLMTTTLSTGSTLTSSSLISTMSTDSATPHSGMTTVQEVTTQDDNSTMSSTINTLPPSSSSSLSSTDSTGISEQTSPSSSSLITITEDTNMTTSASYTTSTTSAQPSPSSSSLITITEETNMTTSASYTTSTTSDQSSPTEPPTESPTAPPVETTMTTRAKVGPVPEPTFPDLGGDAEKTYQFEFAVAENTAAGCNCTNLSSADCESFQLDITEELEDVYNPSTGFESIEVNGLSCRAGSIIVNHTVIYTYDDMSEEDKQASAQTIYDQTLGQAVIDGKLGNYSVIEDCPNCAEPQETSYICEFVVDETTLCAGYSEPRCINRPNYWVCESICHSNRYYCNKNGICWQEDITSEPICSCDWDNGEWYWGYKCQFYANQMYLIIGCSCGAAVLLVIIVSCLVYICTKTCYKADKATSAKSSESGNDDAIHAFHNFGYDHDHTTETANFPPIEDLDEGDILQRSRPYSYIYTGKGDDNANMDPTLIIKNQNGGAQRESRLEINDDAAAKRLSNGSSDPRHSSFLKSNGGYQQRAPEFWGNLDETGVSEAIKLEPVLDHIDVNEIYKIQRPRISTNYSYSNSAQPNLYHSVGTSDHETHFIPEADYAQR